MSLVSNLTSPISHDDRKLLESKNWSIQTLEKVSGGKFFVVSLEQPLPRQDYRGFLIRQSSRLGMAVNFGSHKTLITRIPSGDFDSKRVVALGSLIWKKKVPLVAVFNNDKLSLEPMNQDWGTDWSTLLVEI